MSKFFFKGRKEVRENYGKAGYNTDRTQKAGTEDFPLTLTVASDERKVEIEAILKDHSLFATIEVNADKLENITELESCLHKPKTQVLEATPGRNDPCACGSGKKYKKCCG
ncbi:MAG: PBPRA1643 family SWIM/SEC-C metal-binding motif protein [Pontibacterium sp.]